MDHTSCAHDSSTNATRLLQRQYTTKESFIKEYKEIFGNDPADEEIYLLLLTQLERDISNGKEEQIRYLSSLTDIIFSAKHENKIKSKRDNAITDISNAANEGGSKPIHIAAREGFLSCVKFFLRTCASIDEVDKDKQTPLHYAAMKDKGNVLKFLIEKGSDLNAVDSEGSTPLHLAAVLGHRNCVEILLKNRVIYNTVDKQGRKPLDLATNKDIIQLLSATEKLFKSVCKNNACDLKICIKAGAVLDAQNAKGFPLIHAAWKGYADIVGLLLKNSANPNVSGNNGFSPLHYAVKFSHFEIVKSLLTHGAIFNAVSHNMKKPADLSSDARIDSLFDVINELLIKMANRSDDIGEELKRAKEMEAWETVFGARCSTGKTIRELTDICMNIEQKNMVADGEVEELIDLGNSYHDGGLYQKALDVFRNALIVALKANNGKDNYEILGIRFLLSRSLNCYGKVTEAFDMCQDILLRHEQLFGPDVDDQVKLETQGAIALGLINLDRNEEALALYRKKLPEVLAKMGPDHRYTIEFQNHMAMVIGKLGNKAEALKMHRRALAKAKKILGDGDPITLAIHHDVGVALRDLGEHEAAIKVLKEVLEKKKKIFGDSSDETLRCYNDFGIVLANEQKYDESLAVLNKVSKMQKDVLQPNNPDIACTEKIIAQIQLRVGDLGSAFKSFDELSKRKNDFGPNTRDILKSLNELEDLKKRLGVAKDFSKLGIDDLHAAAICGHPDSLRAALRIVSDVNVQDEEGRTALHHAVNNGHLEIVEILLKNGGNGLKVTSKGNTPLHIASLNNQVEIAEVMLQNVTGDELATFVNAQTVSGSSTSLHVAAKGGHFEMAQCLLSHGARYNVVNKSGKTPMDLAKNGKVRDLLKLIGQLFRLVKNGEGESFSELRDLEAGLHKAVLNARNNEGSTLLQAAMIHKRKDAAEELLKFLKATQINSGNGEVLRGT